ncbi:MAG TPA: response regulator [Nitrososphaeraceae archaeon]|nr:response regulator [Nitrososphaeraceae archaeon]
MDSNNNIKSSSTSTPTIASFYYSLIIMDIRMPGLNGIQLYQILKTLCPNLKILFISALDATPGDIIQKPVEAASFIRKINEAVLS